VAQETHQLDTPARLLALRKSRSPLVAHLCRIHLPIPLSSRQVGHVSDVHLEQRTDLVALARDITRAQRTWWLLQKLEPRRAIRARLEELFDPARPRLRGNRPLDRASDVALDGFAREFCEFSQRLALQPAHSDVHRE